MWPLRRPDLVQALVRMIALCPDWQQAKHLGFANVKGKGAPAQAHLAPRAPHPRHDQSYWSKGARLPADTTFGYRPVPPGSHDSTANGPSG